jgi:hypothetical protein
MHFPKGKYMEGAGFCGDASKSGAKLLIAFLFHSSKTPGQSVTFRRRLSGPCAPASAI